MMVVFNKFIFNFQFLENSISNYILLFFGFFSVLLEVIFRCITSLPAQQGKEPPECESLASSRQRDIEENCGDLYKKVDKEVWTTDQDEVVKELADLAINCFIRKRNNSDKRCTFKDIFKKLDALMKKENIPGYEGNIHTRCICCQLHPLSRGRC
ncbi:uncharacterized protein LOC117105476 [Anneissia japonica]|uniref:uncharacterized protein LOC117105476 n=1 Tax=Anneissia japonica TaxID=1529436 RepID=UPI0014259E7C|nr:uncharacterized protein LOC117105476 [Anneissia japonica]